VGGREWCGIKRKLPRGYVWKVQEAKKKNRKGRAMRGMILGIKGELVKKEEGGKRGRRADNGECDIWQGHCKNSGCLCK